MNISALEVIDEKDNQTSPALSPDEQISPNMKGQKFTFDQNNLNPPLENNLDKEVNDLINSPKNQSAQRDGEEINHSPDPSQEEKVQEPSTRIEKLKSMNNKLRKKGSNKSLNQSQNLSLRH